MKVLKLNNYKDSLYTALSRDIAAFEKNFLLISGGLLAFSITFIKEVVRIDHSILLGFLFTSWALIILSIGIMMFTYLVSYNASNRISERADAFLMEENLFDDEKDLTEVQSRQIKNDLIKILYSNKKILKCLRTLAVIFFLIGLCSLSIFVSFNIVKENNAPRIPIKKEKGITLKLDSLEIISNDSLILINKRNGKF
jgi:hypothetical protein